jgi:hypothetical protein
VRTYDHKKIENVHVYPNLSYYLFSTFYTHFKNTHKINTWKQILDVKKRNWECTCLSLSLSYYLFSTFYTHFKNTHKRYMKTNFGGLNIISVLCRRKKIIYVLWNPRSSIGMLNLFRCATSILLWSGFYHFLSFVHACIWFVKLQIFSFILGITYINNWEHIEGKKTHIWSMKSISNLWKGLKCYE